MSKYITLDNLTTYHNKVRNAINNASPAASPMENITYSSLRSKVNSSTLTPGKKYRITDFVTTTTQEGTRSAGHAFDVIVTADSSNKLNEVARAIQHSGDTYFQYAKLEAWKLWYCLDNDTDRFAWADETNGKGVIYRMIDENNNDVPYDFKNIQFIRYKVSLSDYSSFDNTWQGPWCSGATISDFKYHYTFCGAQPNYSGETDTIDSTVIESVINRAANNTIRPYSYGGDEYSYGSAKILLNNIIFNANYTKLHVCVGIYDEWDFNTNQTSNILGIGCRNITFNGKTEGNTFANYCYEFTVQGDCYNNVFGSNCHNNTISSYFYNNNIGNEFRQNTIGNNFRNNSIGNRFNRNTIGNDVFGNRIGNIAHDNTIGNEFWQNTIGNAFSWNTIGNNFRNNSIGNDVFGNRIGNDYIESCAFGDGIRYCSISYSTGSGNYLQNIIVLNGTQGTSSSRLSLSGLTVGASYSQTCGMNSSGTYTHKNALD